MRRIPIPCWLLAFALVAVAVPKTAQAQYTYIGPIMTDSSGAACRPLERNQEGNDVFREIGQGLITSGVMVSAQSFMCPLVRRNTTVYGTSDVTQVDRVLMTSLRVSVTDGTSSGNLVCSGYATTMIAGTFFSPSRYACGSTNGCTSEVAGSFIGSSQLFWTNPFGSGALLNLGTVNVGYFCSIPKNSNIRWARAIYSPNT
jgi:hypothetical protein